MDKLQVFLALLKKHYFWVLCTLILLFSTFAWMTAVGNIETEAASNQQRIESALADAQQVANTSQHPNDQITAAYNAQTAKLRQEVLQVWNSLYKKQRDTVLQWPPALGEGFIKHVDSVAFMDDIPVDYRDIYMNYIKTRWAELPKIIKARPATVDETAARPRPSARTAIPDYIVVWVDQERIRKDLFSVESPTTPWVWITQEDLWIYETLLNIIKKTNTGAIGPHNAVISTINAMNVGKSAAQEAGGKGQRISMGGGGDAAADSAGSSAGGSSDGAADGMLNGRYVDAVGIPLENGSTARDDEYKRIPVRLILRMDPREVPQLILNCANAALPVEIQQVRVNVEQGGSSDAAIKGPELSAEDRAAGRKTPHVEVSLQGVIYIFNPPKPEKLGFEPEAANTGTATEAFSTEGGTETPTPTFGDEPKAEGSPMATTTPAADPSATPAVPATEVPPGATPSATPAVPDTAPAADPSATDPASTAPASTAPAATETAPPAGAAKSNDLESLFEEDKAEPAPAKP